MIPTQRTSITFVSNTGVPRSYDVTPPSDAEDTNRAYFAITPDV